MSEKRSIDEIFLELCRLFNEKEVKYIVVGGFAVILHGYARTTGDIDFFVHDSEENVEKIKEVLKDFFNDQSIDEIEPDDLRNYSVVRYGTPDDFYIDLIGKIGEVFTFEDVSRDVEIFEIADVRIPVCGLKTLIKMKNTIRHRDQRDVWFLMEKLKAREE